MKAYISIVAFVFVLACTNPPAQAPALPNTPELVAQNWLEDYYNNRFNEAIKLSTPVTVEMINIIREVSDTTTEEILAFKITDLICTTVADSSYCEYLFDEGDLETEDEIFLKRINGQWLVEEEYHSDDGLEGTEPDTLFDSLEQIIEEAIDREEET